MDMQGFGARGQGLGFSKGFGKYSVPNPEPSTLAIRGKDSQA